MTPCPELHIPHKESQGRDELENWLSIERWSRTRPCGGDCACFLQHKSVALTVPMNDYTKVAAWDNTHTCGTRPASDLATTILICNWRLTVSDYSDDTTPPNPAVRFGYGVFATQDDLWIAGSHGFIEWQNALDNPWQGNISNLPAGIEWPDALTSGSFVVPINVAQHGTPVTSAFDIAAVLGVYNPGAGSASFYIDTYEYSLCGCECQE